MKALLTITVEVSGSCQFQDLKECLLDSAEFLHDEGLLTPIHDCELVNWNADVVPMLPV